MTENDNIFYAFAANPGFIEIPTKMGGSCEDRPKKGRGRRNVLEKRSTTGSNGKRNESSLEQDLPDPYKGGTRGRTYLNDRLLNFGLLLLQYGLRGRLL